MARPKGDVKNEQLQCRIAPTLLRDFDDLAHSLGLDASKLVRVLVTKTVAANRARIEDFRRVVALPLNLPTLTATKAGDSHED